MYYYILFILNQGIKIKSRLDKTRQNYKIIVTKIASRVFSTAQHQNLSQNVF